MTLVAAPNTGNPDPFAITTFSQCATPSDAVAIASNAASNTWPVANTVGLFVPFTIIEPHTYVQGNWMNGATLGSNVMVGVYDSGGGLLRATAATAQSGTSQFQGAALSSSLTLAPGTYWIGMAMSVATGTILRASPMAIAMRARSCYQATLSVAGVLQASVTYAAYTVAAVAFVGISERAV